MNLLNSQGVISSHIIGEIKSYKIRVRVRVKKRNQVLYRMSGADRTLVKPVNSQGVISSHIIDEIKSYKIRVRVRVKK